MQDFYLSDEMLKWWRMRRRSAIESVEVGVQGEVGQRFPGRLVALDFHRVHAHGRLVADRRGRHHRDPVHGAVSQLPPVLETKTNHP